MTPHDIAQKPAFDFGAALTTAARLPGVRIDRDTYLRKALARYCPPEQVTLAIETSPAAAGISLEILSKAANDSIRYESTKVTALSAVAGIPGGLALIGTLPADIVQTIAHILRIAQKLAYLYSWPDLFGGEGEALDDATSGMLTLFVGVMFGVQAANEGVARVATLVSSQLLRTLPQRALTQGVIYPVVKSVSRYLGVQMSKQIFARTVSKLVPIVGAVVSGGVTLATFLPMCHNLKKHLSSSILAVPQMEQNA